MEAGYRAAPNPTVDMGIPGCAINGQDAARVGAIGPAREDRYVDEPRIIQGGPADRGGWHRPIGLIVGTLLVGLLAACAPVIENRGNLVDDERMARLEVGETRAEDVLIDIGTPSAVAPFDDRTWYYIGQVTSKTAFFNPEIIDRRVVRVRFDAAGVLSEVAEVTLEEGETLQLVERETPTLGRTVGFLEQMLGNVGRFNTPGGGGGGPRGLPPI